MKPIVEQSLIFVGAVILLPIAQGLLVAALLHPGRWHGWMGVGPAAMQLRPLPYAPAHPALLRGSFAAADFLALTAHRPHRKHVSIDASPEHLRSRARIPFDAEVIASVAALVGASPIPEQAGQ